MRIRHTGLWALAMLAAAGAATPCVASGGGCMVPNDHPGIVNLTRVVTYTAVSGGGYTVDGWQASAFAQANGIFDCGDAMNPLVVGNLDAGQYDVFYGGLHIVASGGDGSVDTDVQPTLIRVDTGTHDGADPVLFNRLSGRFDNDPVINDGPFNGSFRVYYAEASTSVDFTSLGFAESIEITKIGPLKMPLMSGGIPHWSWGFGGGAVTTSAVVSLDIVSSTVFAIEDKITVYLSDGNLSPGRALGVPFFTNNGTTTAHPIVVTANGSLFPGWSNQGGGVYNRIATPTIGAGTRDFSTMTVNTNDQGLDANGDGRLTPADIAIVTGWISTDLTLADPPSNADSLSPREPNGDPNTLAKKFDYDNDGYITSADVTTLQAIYDALDTIGQLSGAFGDTDGDGDRDCADVVTITAFDDYVIGDVDYNPRLDFNLDGILDASDFAEYENTRYSADIDDGSMTGTPDAGIDINDLIYYLILHGNSDPAADIDDGTSTGVPDGVVDSADYDYFYYVIFYGGC